MGKTLRYRARTEWYGIELFDNQDGRVTQLDNESTQFLSELLSDKDKAQRANPSDLPGQLAHLELFAIDTLNCEPLINTPYPKTPKFASAPRRIYWELTRKCNLNCKACFNRYFLDTEELSSTSVLSLAEQMYNSGVYEIRCTGGEPTFRPDFFEIIEELKDMGFYLSMGTNGIYSKNIMSKVMHAPIDWIILSIDGANESSYAEIRGDGILHHALKTLENLASKGCRLRINTLIRKTNYTYEHLKPLAELCERFHIESLNCIPLRPVTNDSKILKLQIVPVEFREFIQGLNRLRQKYQTDFVTTLDLRHTSLHDRIYCKDRSCAAGREGAVISPYGEIYGCSYSLASVPDAPKEKREKYVAGNVLDDDFLTIWNQSERWTIFRDLERYKHKKCKTCEYYITRRCIGNCPIMDKENPAAFDPYCYLSLEPISVGD